MAVTEPPARSVPTEPPGTVVVESSDPPPSKRSCECPRCGYDLAGLPPSWIESCPLQGRCSECGLEFEWGVLFSPVHTYPAWSFEHLRRVTPWSFLNAGARTARFVHFWTALRIEHPVGPGRLALFAFAMFACIWLTASTVNAVVLRQFLGTGIWYHGGMVAYTVPEYVMSFFLPFWYWGITSLCARLSSFGTVFYIFLTAALVVPAHLTITQSMSQARVRLRHLWRAAAYSLAGVAFVLSTTIALRSIFDAGWLQVKIGDPIWLISLKQMSNWMEYGEPIGVLTSLLWLLLFWIAAESRYLKVRHAPAVAVAVLLIAILAATIAMYYLPWSYFLSLQRSIDRALFR
ncbi:MAG TPA: hypothetical protein VG797_07760 [Phycisphaerales bacterium]|nr:hypothetical protein [Phycisphaerales bacterium]